jgi:fatty acid desaturase
MTLEYVVAKKKKKNKQTPEEQDIKQALNQPWISMRSGRIIIAITSVVMAVLTAWQVIPSKGWLEGILWGLLFGALIWAIFFGNILINKLLRR